jgi:UDP-4-amino-4,6-dideoxy-N-acetyl-beta-L-altrosamine N-acetyltransferase
MTDAHLEMVLRWRLEPRVRENMYTQHEITMTEHLAWWDANKDRPDRQYFILEDEGALTGFVSFTDINNDNGTASWAFFSAPDAPKGTGKKMEQLALQHVFSTLGLRKLCCEVLDFNSRVVAFHERFGFEIEGRLKEHRMVDGRLCDVILMAAFAANWDGNEQKKEGPE